ncbi:INTEGRAL MEMBRANE PROTEIN (Rhomboid family) [Minicystis rosea]|nr:INTEGRAL MEMBRANE PROTEIN (Rhomboid family) [Minicystis rosea]
MLKREASREPIDTTTEIETPEHVRFRYQVAGPAMRALAWLIDALARAAIAFVIGIVAVIAGLSTDSIEQASSGVVFVVMFLLEWWYYVFFETLWSGRTPGKRALSLRVVTEGGHPLTFVSSVLRNFLRAADFLPFLYAIGLVVMGRDRRFRRLGDLAAGTIVIAEERHTVAAPLRLDPPPTAAELGRIPQRVPLTGEELSAVELFLRRHGRLSPARENELAEMVAPVFARRLGVRYKDASRFLGLLYHRARNPQQGKT